MPKTVYIAMSADIIHSGHINIINEGAKYGDVIVGVLTDEAIATYKRMPMLDFDTRCRILESIKGVTRVVRQDTLSYAANLNELRPDYVVHGDDWKSGVQSMVRAQVIELLAQWGGQLVEVPYTKGVDSEALSYTYAQLTNSPDARRARLRRAMKLKPFIRAIDVSNGLTGLIAENTRVVDEATATVKEFDAMWVSSLCDSTFKGKPDIELVDNSSRLHTIDEIMEVTTKPIILDGDTGGKPEHFAFHVRTLERMGVSAIIVEDKVGLKKNSLFGTEVKQELDDPHAFGAKIRAGKQAQNSRDFMIIARLESLIAGYGVQDAFERAKIYLDYGADGVMIHSKERSGEDIFEFLRLFKEYAPDVPVVLVPTTYNQFTEEELYAKGAYVMIHANHLLRSAYPAMQKTAISILTNGRSKEASEDYCMPIKQVLELIPGGK